MPRRGVSKLLQSPNIDHYTLNIGHSHQLQHLTLATCFIADNNLAVFPRLLRNSALLQMFIVDALSG